MRPWVHSPALFKKKKNTTTKNLSYSHSLNLVSFINAKIVYTYTSAVYRWIWEWRRNELQD